MKEQTRPDLWVLTELPITADSIPKDFSASLRRSGHLFVVEEHVVRGSVGQELAHLLLTGGRMPAKFTHRCALGYVSGRYGSQKFHRRECGLDPASIVAELQR
jgi:transketolase